MSFISDTEKMVDFFSITKREFLESYSYITEKEYEDTKKEALLKSGYPNVESVLENKSADGIMIGKIIQSIMIVEWLNNK